MDYESRQEDKFSSRDTQVWQESQRKIRTVSSNYTVSPEDDIILVDTTSNTVSITLPSTLSLRRVMVIRIAGVYPVTIAPISPDLIRGQSSVTLSQTYYPLDLKATPGDYQVSPGEVTTLSSPTITGNLTFTGTGNRILGDFSNATLANLVTFQTSTVNGNTNVLFLPNGTGAATSIKLFQSSDRENSPRLNFTCLTGEATVRADISGTGTYYPITFHTGGSERLRIDTSGNVLVTSAAGLGYGTGAGGTVTQGTSKSTAVTLNKPCGVITMHNASLSAGVSVNFTLNNSLLGSDDVLVITPLWGTNVLYYSVRAHTTVGMANILLKNEHSSSLGESVVLRFTIIKGVTS